MTQHNLEMTAGAPRACADVGRRVLYGLPAVDDETRQVLTATAWHEFMLATFREPNARAWFRDDTGLDLDAIDAARTSPIVWLIDDVTGHRREVYERFLEWATERLWGLESAPKTYQDELAKRRAAAGAKQ